MRKGRKEKEVGKDQIREGRQSSLLMSDCLGFTFCSAHKKDCAVNDSIEIGAQASF